MSSVVDASFVLELLTSATAGEVELMALRISEEGVIAPPVFWHEVASGLRNMMLRGRITAEFRRNAWPRLMRWDVEVEPAVADLRAVIAVSDRHQLTVYDAAYLELALRTGARLATRDKALIAAAAKAGVPLAG